MRFIPLFLVSLFLVSCSARTSIPVGEIPKVVAPTQSEKADAGKMAAAVSSKFSVSTDAVQIDRVTKILKQLLDAAGADSAMWNLMILDNDAVINAAAYRGNLLFIWSGLLKFVQTDDELATILGHELGHLLAQHHKGDILETLSKGFASGTAGVAKAMWSDNRTPSYGYRPNSGQNALGELVVGLAFGVTSWTIQKTMIEPESRRKEHEADTIGLFLMKKAGYDPNAAIALWERFSQLDKRDGSGLEILGYNSHPASKDRLKRLKKLVKKFTEPQAK